jgi:hypothetical protein
VEEVNQLFDSVMLAPLGKKLLGPLSNDEWTVIV